VADLLVRKGMPFRQAHGVVGGLVRTALERGVALSELSPDDLAEHSELLDDSYYEVLSAGAWLESKVSAGGTSTASLRAQFEAARELLATIEAPGSRG
jgi:argininosuccinate lyase